VALRLTDERWDYFARRLADTIIISCFLMMAVSVLRSKDLF
jgi:hypothetical protein